MDQPKITVDWDAVDWDRVDEAALAIMLLGLQGEGQVRHLHGRGIGIGTTALREAVGRSTA
jgi:hypothetical protein